MATDNLSSNALDWALTHISRYGDTDIFPLPFEFVCIKASWSTIRPELEKIDLGKHRTHGIQRKLVPKPGGGFRVATQLDPIDAIVYAAFAYEAAAQIEASRIPASRDIACSYRVEIDPNGRLFTAESGWPEFHARSEALCKNGKFSHVLVADIADFYNQIYSHRIQSALEAANVASTRADNIENFLLSLSAKQSRGLPVGPSTSILLAEASLTDVDNFLLQRGVPFTRFVDDFRIFCTSKREAAKIYHDLAEYVYTAHRLILEPWKSKILRVESFTEKELIDPAQLEKQSKLRKLQGLIEKILFESGYSVEEQDLLDADKQKAVRENLVELFRECVAKRPLHLGVARYLLRRATRLRTVVLNDVVFQNLQQLTPAFRDVIKYLAATVPKKNAAKRGLELIKFLRESDYGEIPFLRLWTIELFTTRPDFLDSEAALKLSHEFRADLGIRPAALVARNAKKLDWIRAQKEIWTNYSPWDRRAVIYAGSVLPTKEKRIWLDMVANSTDDILDKAIAHYARQC